MPKLDNKTAKSVNSQDPKGRQALIDPGTYTGKLVSCVMSPKPDRNKNHYWIWQFEIATEGVPAGTKLRTNTGLAENQQWALKRMFDAFGVKPNVDTDTLIGDEIRLVVDQQPMTGGARAGQLRNEIIDQMPLTGGDDDDPDWDTDPDGDGDDPDDPGF